MGLGLGVGAGGVVVCVCVLGGGGMWCFLWLGFMLKVLCLLWILFLNDYNNCY